MKKLMLSLSLAAAVSTAAAQNPSAGQKAFEQCAACHSTAKGVNGVGPSLFGVVGGKAGSVPGFNYSSAMKNSNLTWTAQNLDAYIANPQRIARQPMPYSACWDAGTRGSGRISAISTLKCAPRVGRLR